MMACATHPEVETGLSCGRCETLICPRCLVQTPVGTRTTLQIRRHHESIVVDVVVRRRIEEKDFTGLGVEYVDVPPTTRQSIVELVRAGAPDEDAVFIDPKDPGLH